MKIAICTSEAAPYIKSGGLGDVMEGLPVALARTEGSEIALMLPYYRSILENPAFRTERVAQFTVALGWRQQYAGIHRLLGREDGVQVYFIDNLYYFGDRAGAPYGQGDDGERYAFFAKACLDALLILGFVPDIIHCNDWQTGLVPVFLQAQYRALLPRTRCVFTIHNIEYQGWADGSFFDDVLALPEEFRARLDMGGAVNFLKGAIETADAVTTVSESYARELLLPYYAHGLSAVLSGNAEKLTGITNGIDTLRFDPKTDPALPANYDESNFPAGKAFCKASLQQALGLPCRDDAPMLVMVTRLVGHKGLDLLRHIAHRLLAEDCQLVILGTGDPQYENFFTALQRKYPQKVSANITFDPALASRIYAAGDIFLMPSKSEPCGLSQLYAMRYGTVPVVHAVGGLRDTVPPVDDKGEGGLGFTFQSYNADDFLEAIGRCLKLYRQVPLFQALQRQAMAQDFSWTGPAAKYLSLFQKLTEG